MAWDEDWLTADLERIRDGHGPQNWERWRGLVARVLSRRGASTQDIDDVTGITLKLLMFGRPRARTRDHGTPLCQLALARPAELRPGWLATLAARTWEERNPWSPARRALRQLVAEVLPAATARHAPEAAPTVLRRGGRFDRDAVTQAVAWLLGQPDAFQPRPGMLAAALLELWRFELEPDTEDAGAGEADQVALGIDANRAAERVLAGLDERHRVVVALLHAGRSYREVAALLGCGLATVNRTMREVTSRLLTAAGGDADAADFALRLLQERCAHLTNH